MIRVVQTHTVWFERPFLLRLGTLLPDYTILGKLDFRSRTPRPDSEAGLTRNWAISQFVSKYTVLFLEPIRSLLDPFRVSHTIIGTSDDREGYRGQYPPLRLYLGPCGRNTMGLWTFTLIGQGSPLYFSHCISYCGMDKGKTNFPCIIIIDAPTFI